MAISNSDGRHQMAPEPGTSSGHRLAIQESGPLAEAAQEWCEAEQRERAQRAKELETQGRAARFD